MHSESVHSVFSAHHATLLYRPAGRGHLGAGLLISACLHGLVFYGVWGPQSTAPSAASLLDVVLVDAQTPGTPTQPEVVAQQALVGGGTALRSAIDRALAPRVTPDEQVLQVLRQHQATLERQQQALLTQLVHAQHALDAVAAHEALEGADQDTLHQEHQRLSHRIAALKARMAQTKAQPTTHALPGPAAAQAHYAAYVEAWRRRIEALGTQYYPAEARGRIYGSLQLTVHIHRDGSVARIDVDRPSEHAMLNLAARRIVQLAAPFAPLPEAITREVDVLAITRTWHFTDQQLDTAP